MLFSEIFVIVVACIMWGLTSLGMAVYYHRLLPLEARRRSPTLQNSSFLSTLVSTLLFIAAFLFWPLIAVWNLCAQSHTIVRGTNCCGSYMFGGRPKAGCCGCSCISCEPCISDEVYEMEKTRKEESRRIVGGVQSMQPPMQQTMEMRPYSATSTAQEKRVVESNESLAESAHTTPRVEKD
ncbi:hypothetical protein QBC32DRAFT_92663 [Pseudoneurospora amorphoporcata]|uniref:Uncharacterized protein n=1 Tax=Pseudoneurospora amorphoporcata TaxID=241081 RepID=A0AAN6P263_9PEZI|nr:hypothetical protein QBC32DRAFT_92663 [Pseudoneurospora amorphoporcata]